MDGQITLAEWQQWKEDIRKKLQETKELGSKICNNFVYIGYNLKMAERTEAYKMDGFNNIYDFAQSEYGLGVSEVTRYKQINDRYSVDGNSLEIRDEMREFGLSQLVAMLSLPNEQHSMITPDNTVRQIRELNNFNKGRLPGMSEAVLEELEQPAAVLGTVQTPLRKCIFDFFKDPGRRSLLDEVLERLMQPEAFEEATVKQICDTINPAGNQSHRAGIVFLFMYEYERGVKYKLYTSPRPVEMSWEEFLREIVYTYEQYLTQDGDEEVWCRCYGALKEPEKVQVAGQMNLKEIQKEQIATSQQQSASDSRPERNISEETHEKITTEKDNTDDEDRKKSAEILNESTREEKQIENVTAESEIVTKMPGGVLEEQEPENMPAPAAGVEGIGKIWENAYLKVAKLNLFFQNHSSEEVTAEDLQNVYKNAIDLAADLERMRIKYGKI